MSLITTNWLDNVWFYAAHNAPILDEIEEALSNGDNHIQNFHLGRYFDGYTLGNNVLWLRPRIAVKLNFRPYIQRHSSPNENLNTVIPKYSHV